MCVPRTSKAPVKTERSDEPLSAPLAVIGPKPLIACPLATATSLLASGVLSSKVEKSKVAGEVKVSVPATRASVSRKCAATSRTVTASRVPATLPLAVLGPILPFRNFGRPA